MFLKVLGTLTLCLAVAAAPSPKKKHMRGTVPFTSDKGGSAPSSSASNQNQVGRPIDRSTPAQKSTSTGGDLRGSQNSTGVKIDAGTLKKCEQKQSLETFIQISSATKPHTPPQGGVYFISDLRETPQLFYLNSAGKWPKQMTFFSDGVPYFSVSPDGEKILVATHRGGDEQYQIYLLEPKAALRLTPLLTEKDVRIESVSWGPDSKWFAFTSNARNKTDMDLYRFNLHSQKAPLLSELVGHNEVTDVSLDGKRIVLTNFRSISDSDVVIWDIAEKTLTKTPKKAGESRDFSGLFGKNSKTLFYLSDADKGVVQLHSLDLTVGKASKALTFGKWEIEAFSLNKDRNSLILTENEEGYAHFAGFEVDGRGKRGKTFSVPTSPNSIVSSASLGDRGNIFFAETSSVRNSDIWEWRGEKRVQWTQAAQVWMDSDCLSREELVHYPTFDGKVIPAFLYLPQDAHGPVPFIVSVHGGPESQYRPAFSRLFQYFLQRGFGVLAPNVRGSTGYGRDYTRLDNYKLRMDSVKDVIAGAKWLLTSHYTLPGKLAITGGSYGGFMVLRSLEVEPDLFSAAAESVGIANFVTFLNNTKPYRRSLREAEYGPLGDEEFLKSISPMTYADQIKTPLMVFHGANDPRVPVSETEQMIAALRKKEVPVEFKIFPDEGHGNTKLRNIMEQAQLTVYFFEKYTAGRSVTSPP